MSDERRFRVSIGGFILLTVLMGWIFASAVLADDRALFQATNAKPYVFFIVDISSSMHLTPTNDRTPASGEDPTARLYLAKRAAFEVIEEVGDSVNYGWATFNRERMRVRRKHWLYTLETNPPFFGTVPILPAGKPIIFGEPRHRNTGEVGDSNSDFTFIDDSAKYYSHRSCDDPTPTENRILDFPKGGHIGDYTTVVYWEDTSNSKEYRVTFLPMTGADNNMGDMSIDVTVRIEERTGDCSNENGGGSPGDPPTYTLRHEETLTYTRFYTNDLDATDPLTFAEFTDYISFGRSGNDTATFNMDDYEVTSACAASNLVNPADPDDGRSHRWDGNYDGDLEFGDQLTYDFVADPLNRGRELARGDMIPWDWESNTFPISNREEILLRLAPNLSIGETIPDFRVARYFEDVPVSKILPLKADFVSRPPIMNSSGTPIAGALQSFKGWYDDWLVPARDTVDGDPALDCRQKFIILLTDGAESCESGGLSDSSSNRRRLPREEAAALYDRGIRTFVVAFGTTAAELDSLKDIADEGGTGAGLDANGDGEFETPGIDKDGDGVPDGPGPIAAANKDELVEALLRIFQLVQPEATAISAAAVPSVQADVADKIYLTEFTPLDTGSVWPGSLQSFIKPLPLDADGLPDQSRKCDTSITSSCLAWDAQDVVVKEQVKSAPGSAPLGFLSNQRRIFYSTYDAVDSSGTVLESSGDLLVDNVPRQRRLFEDVEEAALGGYPEEAYDLWRGLGIDLTAVTTTVDDAADLALKVTDQMAALKTATLPDGEVVEFVVGDFFHSDPLVVDGPGNTTYFLTDLEGDPGRTCEDGDPKSYRCFSLRHRYRRKLLFIGSNAGMLHAFDAGNYRQPPAPEGFDQGEFDNGTGRELFAYVPRPVMPTLVDMFVEQTSRHKFTVDGPPVAADVFVDPVHTGLPTDSQREWRTVLMGGLRRGGAEMGDDIGSYGDLLDPAVVRSSASTRSNSDLQVASGYYLLDITQPDLIEDDLIDERNDRDGDGKVDIWVPEEIVNTASVPECLDDSAGLPTGCGPLPFGTPMWEFLDVLVGGTTTTLSGGIPTTSQVRPVRLDEDDNGYVDLAPTWSKPVIGRLEVCIGTETACNPIDPNAAPTGTVEDRYVAIFGGGVDPLHLHERGNFIYMVDVETGKTLYKQAITDIYQIGVPDPINNPPVVGGSVAASPAVQETSEGYIDRIYFGTTLGFLYRLDMRPVRADGRRLLPRLQDVTIQENIADPSGTTATSLVTADETRILPNGNEFRPMRLFNVNEDTPFEPRSIYMTPSVFSIPDLGVNGLAFGTGNRENLFEPTPTRLATDDPRRDRFVVFVDDVEGLDLRDLVVPFTPRTVTPLEEVGTTSFSGQNLLTERTEGERGWYYVFEEEERLVGEPLVLAGVLFFSSFTPALPELIGAGSNTLCEESGLSRVFGALVTNAQGVLADENGLPSLSIDVGGLVTAPFPEPSATKNPPDSAAAGGSNELTPELRALMEELKALFPASCTFPPGHRLDIKVRNQDTGLTFVVPVPICVIDSSFKEF